MLTKDELSDLDSLILRRIETEKQLMNAQAAQREAERQLKNWIDKKLAAIGNKADAVKLNFSAGYQGPATYFATCSSNVQQGR